MNGSNFLVIISCLFFLSCNQTSEVQSMCFCDKIEQELIFDTTEYFICEKRNNVYKLEINKKGLLKLSKHKANNLGYMIEIVTLKDNSIQNENSNYIKVFNLPNSTKFFFTKSNIDSIHLFLSPDGQIKNKFSSLGNSILIQNEVFKKNERYLFKFEVFTRDTNYVELAKYYPEIKDSLIIGKKPFVRSVSTYYYKSYKEILSENLDSVLYKILKCRSKLPPLSRWSLVTYH